MDTKTAGTRLGATFLVCIALQLSVVPAAAATCTLAAPPRVDIGTPLSIVGSGFPANSIVDISFTADGVPTDDFPQQSDANGSFQINLTPEAEDMGTIAVVATAGANCTARAVIDVSDPSATATPPGADPGAGAGAGGQPPRTDTAGGVTPSLSGASPFAFALAVFILAVGCAGLIATRPVRRRSGTPPGRANHLGSPPGHR